MLVQPEVMGGVFQKINWDVSRDMKNALTSRCHSKIEEKKKRK